MRNSYSCRQSRAFTLVELLVVIAIIGVLVGLLLPAVQAAREAARRNQCLNNIKQLGLSAQAYHDANNELPGGNIWAVYPQHNYSTQTALLPYLEQQSLYNSFNFKLPPVQDQKLPDGTTPIGATPVSVFVCPADDSPLINENGYAKHNYSASVGPADIFPANPSSPCSQAPALNSQYSLGGRDSAADYPGPFNAVYPTVGCKFREITDGLSNTIFFGEVLPKCSVYHSSGWARMNNGNAVTSTVVPVNTNTCDKESADGCRRPDNWTLETGFRSDHPGGAHFSMGDGSGHFFSEGIDHRTYNFLGGRRDDQAVNIP